MNVMPNLHSTLINVPKMADADYIAAVFNKKEAGIYNATTTIVSASKDPILVAPPLKDRFGIWQYKFPLQFKLIFIIAYIFLNVSIIMLYSPENCIDVQIPFD